LKVLVIKIIFWILLLKKYKHEFLRFIESDRIYENFKIKKEIPRKEDIEKAITIFRYITILIKNDIINLYIISL